MEKRPSDGFSFAWAVARIRADASSRARVFLSSLGESAGLGAVLGALASLPATAQDKSELTFTGNAALATDYIFRGISQTGKEPAVSAGFNYGHTSGIFLGVWGSNVDFNDGGQAHLEFDVFGGIRREYRGVTWELGVIHYAYPGAADTRSYDYDELRVALGYDFRIVAATASVN